MSKKPGVALSIQRQSLKGLGDSKPESITFAQVTIFLLERKKERKRKKVPYRNREWFH
jgi:hypothetical protein